MVSGWPEAARRRGAGPADGGRWRRCRSGEGERARSGRRASPRRGGPVPGFSWDRGRAESRAPRWCSGSGGNGGAATPWVHEQGLGLAFIAARERGGSAGRGTRSLGRCAALGQGSGRGRRMRRAASALGTSRCRAAIMAGSGAQRGGLGRRSGDGTGRVGMPGRKP